MIGPCLCQPPLKVTRLCALILAEVSEACPPGCFLAACCLVALRKGNNRTKTKKQPRMIVLLNSTPPFLWVFFSEESLCQRNITKQREKVRFSPSTSFPQAFCNYWVSAETFVLAKNFVIDSVGKLIFPFIKHHCQL